MLSVDGNIDSDQRRWVSTNRARFGTPRAVYSTRKETSGRTVEMFHYVNVEKRPVNANLMGFSPSSPRFVRRGGNAVLGYKVRRQRCPQGFRMVADVLPIMYISHEALKGEIIDLAFHLLATVVRDDPQNRW